MPPDAGDEIDENDAPAADQAGEQGDDKPRGDHADGRQPEQADQATADRDAPNAENDPLVLAQQEAPQKTDDEPKPKAAPPKPAAETPAPESGEAPAEDEEDEPDGEAEPDPKPAPEHEPEPIANLPQEDWQKLSHKGKSQFLNLRKRAADADRKAAAERAEAEKARKAYAEVETFVRKDAGLNDQEFANAVQVAALAKRGDQRVLPALRATIKAIEARHGIVEPKAPEPPPVKPAVDLDALDKAIEQAEADYDFAKLKELTKQARAAAAKPATPPAAQAQPKEPAPAGPAARQGDGFESYVNRSVSTYLIAHGVKQDEITTHLERLIAANPELATAPVEERLERVMRAHSAARAKAQQPRQPAAQPLSGRGRPPATAGRTTATTTDPLKLALASRGR